MLIDLAKYLTVALILFLIGISGIILNRKNIIVMLMSIELMLLAVNLNFIIFSVYLLKIALLSIGVLAHGSVHFPYSPFSQIKLLEFVTILHEL